MAAAARKKTLINEQRGSANFMVDPAKPLIIGYDTKHKRGEHILWQQRALDPVDEALAQDIAIRGFRSVVLVRLDGPNYEIVAGRRRVKAARRANEIRASRGLEPLKIEIKVVKGSDLEMVGLMISENSHRLDVAPLQMAEDLQNYLTMGASEEQVAITGGKKTVTQLRAFLRILDLDAQVKTALENSTIAVTAAMKLAELTREDQVKQLTLITSGEAGKTAADISAAVRAKKEGTEDVLKAPGKRLINKLLESEEGMQVLAQANSVDLVRWTIGELHPRKIKGLMAAINKVSGK